MFPQLLETVEISLQVSQFVVTLYFFDNAKFHAQRVSQDTQNNIWISWICGKSFLISTSSSSARTRHVSGNRDILS